MSALRLSVVRRLTVEECLDQLQVDQVLQQMVARLQAAMVARGLEPQSGDLETSVEEERTPGREHPRAWWEVLMRIPARREPDTIRNVIRISAVGAPLPRGGDQ